jgi:hypothetical protein
MPWCDRLYKGLLVRANLHLRAEFPLPEILAFEAAGQIMGAVEVRIIMARADIQSVTIRGRLTCCNDPDRQTSP